MHIKLPLAGIVLAGVGLAVTSCAVDPVPVPQSELFNREFIKQFGVVDPSQDWNNATRGSVKVNVKSPSRIKVTTKIGTNTYLLADYSDVNGSRSLEFDMPRGVKDVTVTCGNRSIDTKVGGEADFGNKSRAIWDDKTGDPLVKISRKPYRLISDKAVRAFGEYLPEGIDNRNKVTQNFSYVANGPFTIYPVYWNTNAYLTLGIYYIKNEGADDEKMVVVPFYTNKIQREGTSDGNLQYLPKAPDPIPAMVLEGEHDVTIHSYNSNDHINGKYDPNDFTDKDWEIFKKNYIANGIEPALNNGTFEIPNYWLLPQFMRAKIKITDIEYTYRYSSEGAGSGIITITKIYTTEAKATVDDYSDSDWTYPAGSTCSLPDYGTYKAEYDKGLSYDQIIENGFKPYLSWRSEGIHIDIERGTKFGMFIRHQNNAPTEESIQVREIDMVYNPERGYKMPAHEDGFTRMYSQSKYNSDNMADTENPELKVPSVHAATYNYTAPSGITYQVLGFEDWYDGPSDEHDLNDMIFFIDSENPLEIPDVKDEDKPENEPKPIKWLIACEDLGMLDDFDFNDVVFEVEHVSGQTTAKIQPLASGGTLPVYLMRENVDGTTWTSPEWHSLFGKNSDTPVNVGMATGTAEPIEITVPEDFTITSSGTGDGYKKNMGGFYLKVTRENGDVVGIDAPNEGDAPQMFLIYQSAEKPWRWPRERSHITWGYPKFKEWMNKGNFEINLTGSNWWDEIGDGNHLHNR